MEGAKIVVIYKLRNCPGIWTIDESSEETSSEFPDTVINIYKKKEQLNIELAFKESIIFSHAISQQRNVTERKVPFTIMIKTMLPRNKCNKRYIRVFMKKLQNLLKNVIE